MELREEFAKKASDELANMSELCREYGISRKTGYKWRTRYRTGEVLRDRSRRPKKLLTTSAEVVLRLVELRKAHPFWGARKLRVLLSRELHQVPSEKTVARILERLDLPRVRPQRERPRRTAREGGALGATKPNDVWTIDFKGWWRTKDGSRFEPLTVRDAASRFVLLCRHVKARFSELKEVFERLFTQYGLPRIIRVDNGSPFAASNAPGGLSRLSAWWTALGINVSFSRPAHPQDNGAHERLHADISFELQSNPAATVLAQQRVVDVWVRTYNHVRPHEGLKLATPASVYRRSTRRLEGVRPYRYPADAIVRQVSVRGRVAIAGYDYFVGTALAGYSVGLRHIDGQMRLLFYGLDLGPVTSKGQRRL